MRHIIHILARQVDEVLECSILVLPATLTSVKTRMGLAESGTGQGVC